MTENKKECIKLEIQWSDVTNLKGSLIRIGSLIDSGIIRGICECDGESFEFNLRKEDKLGNEKPSLDGKAENKVAPRKNKIAPRKNGMDAIIDRAVARSFEVSTREEAEAFRNEIILGLGGLASDLTKWVVSLQDIEMKNSPIGKIQADLMDWAAGRSV